MSMPHAFSFSATMDDISSPDSSVMSVFDDGHQPSHMLAQDGDVSPYGSSHSKHFDSGASSSHTANNRPVAILPATEDSRRQSLSGATGSDFSTSQPMPTGSGGGGPPTANGHHRRRRSKKNGEKKDPAAGSTGSDGTQATGTTTNAAGKIIKRRAARACVSCRNRKVRCDVVETFPCGNCRWDKIECVVQEGRRRRRGLFNAREAAGTLANAEVFHNLGHESGHGHSHSVVSDGSVNGSTSFGNGYDSGVPLASSVSASSMNGTDGSRASFDSLWGFGGQQQQQQQHQHQQQRSSINGGNAMLLPKTSGSQSHSTPRDSSSGAETPLCVPSYRLLPINGVLGDPHQQASMLLPGFIRPLPTKMASDDILYLHNKGALTLPDENFQRVLLHAYVEFVHPYMPLLELHPFLHILHNRDGSKGTVSLLLYHAVMFAGAAFVPAKYLKAAGFSRRREARKIFFMKARVLYDFDYESDRFTLVQALLLMTYWYETPDDQKDTWHWMGVAVSLAHTIGLHRDPRTTGEPLRRQKLRKLLWWCCFMRDRMIALGMRRPKRIRSEDADVPLPTPSDFERAVLPEDVDVVPAECRYVRDLDMQEQLAELCVEKAKLCVLVGSMLQQQYTILPRGRGRERSSDSGSSNSSSNGHGHGNGSISSITTSTMMLFPNRPASDDGKGNGPSMVDKIDAKLRAWLLALPLSCRYAALQPSDVMNGRATVAVQRTLLHLVYHTTMSALHRPRIQPVVAGAPLLPLEQQEFSRARVRDAADCVARMGSELLRLRLEAYLPTAGVTVFLPAMFAHLLDIKGSVPRERRYQAILGFRTCMRIMESLRDIYAAAEIAKGFVEALLQKAGIDLATLNNFPEAGASVGGSGGGGGEIVPPSSVAAASATASAAAASGGTGTTTPIGPSASLLNATSNVAVPYTEDGVAQAVALYATSTPRPKHARLATPPADGVEEQVIGKGRSDSTSTTATIANGLANAMTSFAQPLATTDAMADSNDMTFMHMSGNGVNGVGVNGVNVNGVNSNVVSSNGGSGSNANLNANINSTNAGLNMSAVGNGNNLWGVTPSGSNGSEDPFEWDASAADPNAMKLDFDQWLDFPPEGMGSSTDHVFAGLFGSNFANDIMKPGF